jgi:hypothetical protein
MMRKEDLFMLKHNGKPVQAPAEQQLTRGETDAFNDAFEAIRDGLESLERAKQSVRELATDATIFTIPQGPPAEGVIEIPNVPVDRWQLRSTLPQLGNSHVFLCDRTISGVKEFAIIERFRQNSPFAQANGNAAVLLTGSDPVRLVQEYAEDAQRTLSLIANNLLAKAHRIVWERFANTSPVRVLKAISEKCVQAASLDNGLEPRQAISRQSTGNHLAQPVTV